MRVNKCMTDSVCKKIVLKCVRTSIENYVSEDGNFASGAQVYMI